MAMMHSPPDQIVTTIAGIFRDRGAQAYAGEDISVSEHMLQCGSLAMAEAASDALVVAALLHDIGHLTSDLGEYRAGDTVDRQHDLLGAALLEQYFPMAVTEPVRLHVAAKRYLCATDDAYYNRLSTASRDSLGLQGGPMSLFEADAFRRLAFHEDAIRLRRWDDSGKVLGVVTLPLAAFDAVLVRVRQGK